MIGIVEPQKPLTTRRIHESRRSASASTSRLNIQEEEEEDYTYLLIERRRRRLNRYNRQDDSFKESRSKSVETRLLTFESRGKLLKSDTTSRPRSSPQDTSSTGRTETLRSPFRGNNITKRDHLTKRSRSVSAAGSRYSADSDYDSPGPDPDQRSKDTSDLSVRSLRDSPKWSVIKQKFESTSANTNYDKNSSKNSSPQVRRKSLPVSPLSSSTSNLPRTTASSSKSSSSLQLPRQKDLNRGTDSNSAGKMMATEKRLYRSKNIANVSYNERFSHQKCLSMSTPSVNLASKIVLNESITKTSSISNSDLSGVRSASLSSKLSAESISRVVMLAAKFDPLIEQRISNKGASNKSVTNNEGNSKQSSPLSVKERIKCLEKHAKRATTDFSSTNKSTPQTRAASIIGDCVNGALTQRSHSVPIPHPRKNSASNKSDYDVPKAMNGTERSQSNGKTEKNDSNKQKRMPLPNPRKFSMLQNSSNTMCRSPSGKLIDSSQTLAIQNSEYESVGNNGGEENIYESLWSLSRPCGSPVSKAMKKFSDSDDLSLNSDSYSVYSDSSSYSSGNYEYSGFTKGINPPPLPPRRFNSISPRQRGSYSNMSSCGTVSDQSRLIAEELVDIYESSVKEGQDEEHIYQSIYDRIQNTEGFSKSKAIPSSENEELLKSLIKELQKIVKEAKIGKGKKGEDDATSRGSEDGSELLSRGSFSSKSGSSTDGSPKSSFRNKRPTSFTNKHRASDPQAGRDYANLSGKDARYANCPPISEDTLAQRNSLIASIIDSTSEDIKQFLASSDRRRQSCMSSASEAYVTANVFEEQKRTNLNDLEDDGKIFPFTGNRLVTVRQLSENERYIDFEKTDDSPLENQPLYQFYDKQVKRREAMMMYADSSVVNIEDYFYNPRSESLYSDSEESEIKERPKQLKSHVSVMDIVDGGFRRLWCEVPQVKEQGLLEKLTPEERKRQEAMFEVITSEASYLKSLNVLINNFYNHPDFQNPDVIDARKRKDFFSNIEEVYQVAKKLMTDLERIWEENIIISGVCEILHHYAINYFHVYVTYCKYQMNQERILRELQEKSKFAEVLKRLEANACCQGLTILSFILLPMQRITRYPLLVDAILTRLDPSSPEMETCKKTLLALNKVVRECNSAARQFERWHELSEVERKLRFMNIKKFPLASASRFLLKKGEVTRIKPEYQTPLLIGSMSKNPYWSKSQNYLFLFNDLLVITKRKSEDNFHVYDYCDRNLVHMLPVNNGTVEGGTLSIGHKPPENFKFLVQATLLQNHNGKSVDYYFNFSSENERLRWIEAVEPPKSENPNEKIYEEWDCPQVLCERRYLSEQPDELSLEEADVINVFRKSANDWYEGERIRDGARGWFPASHTVEIANKHVRARNLRIRHRLMILTESYLENQHRN